MIAWLEQMWVIVFTMIVTVPLIIFGLVLLWRDHKSEQDHAHRAGETPAG
jgi:prolipoprotein diacylglyceryltransferase